MADLAASKLGGTSVEVLNSQGDVLGKGLTTPAQVGYDTASVTFALEVPETTLYTVAVAGFPGPTFTFEELEANNFSVVLQQTISADEFLNLVCPTEIEDWRRRHGDVGITDTNVALVAIRSRHHNTQTALLSASEELEELPFGDKFVVPQSIDSTGRFILGSIIRLWQGPGEVALYDEKSGWSRVACPRDSSGHAVNARGDVVGSVRIEGFHRAWFKPCGRPLFICSARPLSHSSVLLIV